MSLLIDLLRGSNCTLMNKMKKNLQSNILLLPALIAGFFCYLFPILIAFWKSLFLGTGTDFVGIQNYVDLFENEAFSLAVRNLFHLWAIIIPVNLVIGIFIAEVYIKFRQEKLCLFFLVPSILPAACVVTIASKYSLQGTTQSRYLTGGSARQIFHVMFKLSLVAAMVVIIKSTTRRLSSKDTFSQVSR